MSTETILTDEQRRGIEYTSHVRYAAGDKNLVKNVMSLTEQAVLQSEQVQAWKRDSETERAIQHAAEVLPDGWNIYIGIEKDSGYIGLYYQGVEVEFGESGNRLADRIKDAINAAMEQQT